MIVVHNRNRWGVAGLLGALLLAGVTTGGGPAAAASPAASCVPAAHVLPGTFTSGLSDVAAAAPGDVWAVGAIGGGWQEYQGVLPQEPAIMHWAGTEWTSVPVPPTGDGGLTALTAFGPHDVWAVGFTTSTPGANLPPPTHSLALHWDGSHWQVVPTPDPPAASGRPVVGRLSAVNGSSPTDLWAAGATILHGDGTGWQVVAVNGIPAGQQLALSSLAVASRNDVWAAGTLEDSVPNPAPPGILLHWNGRAWAPVGDLPAGFEPRAVSAVRGQAGVWAVGNGAAHWDGHRWTAVVVPGLGQGYLRAVTVTAAGDAWATGTVVGIPAAVGGDAIFHWDGHTWQLVPDPAGNRGNTGFSLYGIGVEGAGDVWAVGASNTTTGHWSASDGRILHIFSPCALPTAAVADPHTPGVRYFPEVQHTLRGTFRAYWEAHGGLAQFGYPITEEFSENSTADGRPYTVQYFQRNRFERHPENAGTPYEVQLGLLGRTVTQGQAQDSPFAPPFTPPAGRLYFPQTGHTLAPEFADYWQAHGGLAVFGYPISEPYQESSPPDFHDYLAQYFERNRLEYHPELPPAFRVSLGLLGADVLRLRGWLP